VDEPQLTVLHVDTERGWRGGERQVLWLAAGMRERGHRAIVVARHADELARRAADRGLEVITTSPRGELDLSAAYALRRAVVDNRADVIHAHTAHAAAQAALAQLGTTAKLVMARRVDFPLRRNVITRLKYGRADAVIAVSRAAAEVAAHRGVHRDRIHIVPDGVDLRRQIRPADRETLRSLGIGDETPLIVQVAALVPQKDPLTFIRAIGVARQRVPELRALMVGDGPLRAEAQDEVKRLRLDRVIALAGFRRDADELLAAGTVAVLSSVAEGLGSVVLDAMAFGVPIAATTAGGVPDVITHGETGLLSPPRDASALAENIVRLLLDRALAASLTARARERVKDFSVERMVDRTLDVYARIGAVPSAFNADIGSSKVSPDR
jgi:glycosyltransferase involved in cell wall biosynthesis